MRPILLLEGFVTIPMQGQNVLFVFDKFFLYEGFEGCDVCNFLRLFTEFILKWGDESGEVCG
jgi:hypothetical protein